MANITGKHDDHHFNHGHGRPRVTMLVNEEISQLAPYSGLILTISLIMFFIVRYYLFETFLLKRMYGKIYSSLNDNRRRGFINHHVAATAKIIMLSTAAYPFFAVIAGKHTLHEYIGGRGPVTFGDGTVLICC